VVDAEVEPADPVWTGVPVPVPDVTGESVAVAEAAAGPEAVPEASDPPP